MMVVWFAKSWLIAAAMSALIVKLYALLVIPLMPATVAMVPAAVTAAVWVIVLTVALLVSSLPSMTLQIVLLAYL
jgi:hypothetical protein